MHSISVAIPASNEAAVIAQCLAGIDAAASHLAAPVSVVVLVNNSSDGTADVARRAAAGMRCRMRVIERHLPADRADAGRARRLAMQEAAEMCGREGIVLTTDADARLSPLTLAALARSAVARTDVVCGSIWTSAPGERRAQEPQLLFTRPETRAYWALAAELRRAIDRLNGDLSDGRMPHYHESGACLAVSARFLDRIGGMPDVAESEDRALVRRAEEAGVPVWYCDRARAWVSARLDGRARSGMADALRRRLTEDDPPVDSALDTVAAYGDRWRATCDAAVQGQRGPGRRAAPALRESDLARDLPALAALVRDEVRPAMADLRVRENAA